MRIGILDSGLGGLTVASEIRRLLPAVDLFYLGDTARVPYGSRTPETVTLFATELVAWLLAREVDAIVVACNTISAVALPTLSAMTAIPLVDVIGPTVAAAARAGERRIGVIGTRATVGSGRYRTLLEAAIPGVEVRQAACPLFVPLVENGYADRPIARAIVQSELAPFLEDPPGLLLLGCTHYPYLRGLIRDVLPETVLLESGAPTAEELRARLGTAADEGNGTTEIHLTMASELDGLLPENLRDAGLTIGPLET